MKRKAAKIFLGLCTLLVLLFAADYLSLRFRVPGNRPQLGSVTVHRFYRTALKNGRSDIQYDGDYAYDCVHAIFPHFGDKPCWYLGRKTEEWIDIKSGTSNNPHIF